jgi:hypothetical protein
MVNFGQAAVGIIVLIVVASDAEPGHRVAPPSVANCRSDPAADRRRAVSAWDPC